MTIDLATPADVPRLAELLGELFAQEAEFSPDAAAQSRGLHAILAAPSAGTILALRDGATVIGTVTLLYAISTALGARVATLEDLVVAAGHRGDGAGGMLLDAAIEHAGRAGCARITLLTDRANVGAQRFYARRGFATSTMVPMRWSVDAEAGDPTARQVDPSALTIRPFAPADERAAIDLWTRCGLVRPTNDPAKDVRRKLADSPALFLVATIEDAIVGTAMVGYEGHRGWINYLAAEPTLRRRGIGRALMAEAERLLHAQGCPKVNLQVRTTNREVLDFYRAIGFVADDVVSLGKRLERD